MLIYGFLCKFTMTNSKYEMKKPVLLIAIIFFSILFLGNRSPVSPQEILLQIQEDYIQGMNDFHHSILMYKKIAGISDVEALRTIHLQTRKSFKEISFLLSFYESERVKLFINAAPLPYGDVINRKIITAEPVGLQVLDELVFEEKPDFKSIKILVSSLEKENIEIIKSQERQLLSHEEIFEATREEILRIFSLGLTGFDTPGSLNAIPETQASLEGMKKILKPYFKYRSSKSLKKEFKKAIRYLNKKNNFNEFDRLDFLKKHIQPIYEGLYDLHYALGNAFFDEEDKRSQPIYYSNKNIFSDDFLNPAYFLGTEINTSLGEQRIEIGRRLFHDPSLSQSGKMSCATCHVPEKAFTDALPKSIGNDGVTPLQRNSPTLINAIFSTRFFYDLKERRLENQVSHVVVHPLEYNTDFETIINTLKQNSSYIYSFQKAYKTQSNAISVQNINNALATYVASLVSFNSPFDKYVRNEGKISESAKRGFNLFMGKAACGTCHFAPVFNGLVPPEFHDTESEVLGVPMVHDTLQPVLDGDLGRYESGFPIDQIPIRKNAFKTVTVRNILHTAPYMHNGAYETLEGVIDFYNRGGGRGMGMDVPNQTLSEDPLNLSEKEKKDLISFLESLSEPQNSPIFN